MPKNVLISPLKIIEVPDGDVLHAVKVSDTGFHGFGEAYFSTIKNGKVKAWKRHRKMTLNLVVPTGAIRFVLFDDRDAQTDANQFQEVTISSSNYCRLTVPPMVWLGFQGIEEGLNLLLNVADFEHDPLEVDRKEIEEIAFDWSQKV